MAYTDGYTGDAAGGIGQGLAFVLPEGKSAAYAMQLAQTHASQLQDMARQKLLQQQKLQTQYETDFKNQQLPKAFAPFDKELNDRFNKWLQKGAAQYASTGKNPYNDPNFIKEYNDNVLTPARQSLELGQNYTKLRAIAETDPTNKYTKASKQAVIDYEKTIKDDPFKALTQPLPQLVETPATADDLVKTLKPSGNDSYNKAQIFSAALGDPKWHDMLKQFGYNTDLPDFGVYTDPKSPNGKRVWYTNPTYTEHMADQILESPNDPKSQHILQTLEIDPVNDKFAKEKLQHAISDQNAAMGKFVTSIAPRLFDAEKAQKDAMAAERMGISEARLGIAEKQLGLAEERLKFSKEKQDAKTFYARNLSDRMLSGEDGAGEELSSFYQGNPNYGQPLQIGPMKNGKRTITVPAKMKANPNYSPLLPESKTNPKMIESQKQYSVNLDFNKPYEAKAQLASVMHNVGINVNPDKYMQPTPHKNQETQGAPTTYDPKLPFKSFNGHTLTHKQLIDAGYSEERIKKYIEEGKLKQ